jgi:hypothetical protein
VAQLGWRGWPEHRRPIDFREIVSGAANRVLGTATMKFLLAECHVEIKQKMLFVDLAID